MLAALTVVIGLAVAPAARATFATTYYTGTSPHQQVRLWEDGPAQDVLIAPKYGGSPALTEDEPGAQRIDIYESADSFDRNPVPPAGTAGCWTPSAQHAQCLADPQQQATWRNSSCSFPPGCTGPGASGLLQGVWANLQGGTVRYRDSADGEPVNHHIVVGAAVADRTVTLTSARTVDYRDMSGTGRDHVTLRLETHDLRDYLFEGDSQLSLGGGDDDADTVDAAHQGIACGGGTDTIVVGPEDSYAADCENVTVSS